MCIDLWATSHLCPKLSDTFIYFSLQVPNYVIIFLNILPTPAIPVSDERVRTKSVKDSDVVVLPSEMRTSPELKSELTSELYLWFWLLRVGSCMWLK